MLVQCQVAPVPLGGHRPCVGSIRQRDHFLWAGSPPLADALVEDNAPLRDSCGTLSIALAHLVRNFTIAGKPVYGESWSSRKLTTTFAPPGCMNSWKHSPHSEPVLSLGPQFRDTTSTGCSAFLCGLHPAAVSYTHLTLPTKRIV